MNRYSSVFLISVLIGSSTFGQAIFEAPVPIGPNIDGIQRAFVGDIDGDGQQEVILGSTQYGGVVALTFVGDSVSSMQRLLPVGPSSFMGVGDLNADGIPDLIRSRIEGDADTDTPRIAVFLGQGDGTFSAPITTDGSTSYTDVTAADLTGDGIPEIILSGGPSIDVYNFDANVGQIALVRSLPSGGKTIADITGDGVLDLIIRTGTTIMAWDATTGPTSQLIMIDSNFGDIGRIGAADFNGDGLIDLFAGGNSEPQHSSFMIWANLGAATFLRSPLTYLGIWFDDTYQFRNLAGAANLFFVNNHQLIRTQIHPDLTYGPFDTLETVLPGITDFSLTDVDGDGEEDILVIAKDDRLLIAHGDTAQLFGPILEKFVWNHANTGPTVAVYPHDNGIGELAFISNNSSYPPVSGFHLLKADANVAVPSLTAEPMLPAYWYSDQCRMYPIDMDNDGDIDLVGYQPNWDPFKSCQLFCMEDSSGIYVQRCLGHVMSGTHSIEAYILSSLNVIDVNGDGLKDLLIQGHWVDLMAPQDQSHQDYVLLQTTPLHFEIGEASLPIGTYASHRDLDGDGLEELLVQPSANELDIYHNDGNGAFTLLPALSIDHYGSIGWKDMNGDGTTDQIWTQLDGDSIRINFSTITLSGISPPTEIFSMATPPFYFKVEALDLEGDGDIDFLLSLGTTLNDHNSYDLFPYVNTGSYPLSRGDFVYHSTSPFVPLDADGDGDLDLVAHQGASFFFLKNTLQAVGVPELSTTDALLIHPNPGTDNFTIDLPASIPEGTLFLHDVTGREVLRQRVSAGSAVVYTARLPAGLFTYRLVSTTGKDVRSGKWMKQ